MTRARKERPKANFFRRTLGTSHSPPSFEATGYPARVAACLRDELGVRIPLHSGALLLGRGNDCQVVVDDARVSRRHVLIIHGPARTELIAVGKRPVLVDGEPVSGRVAVADGSVLLVEGHRFHLELGEEPKPTRTAYLALEGRRYAVHKSPFSIGGDAADDLSIAGLPPALFSLFWTLGGHTLSANEPFNLGGVACEAGTHALGPDAAFGVGDVTFRLGGGAFDTATAEGSPLARAADLEFMPNGGLLHLTLDKEHAIWLPHRRADLVAVLLSPPVGYGAGGWVPDDVLIPRVWVAAGAGRVQLNTLIHRTRLSFSEAGLPGPTMVERIPGGGATRFPLAQGATARVR